MRLPALLYTLAAASWALVPAAGLAADPNPPAPTPAASSYPAPDAHGKLELSLADAIGMGIENNLGLEIVRHQPLISYEDWRIAWGAYDPNWFSEFGYSEIETPSANLLAGSNIGQISTTVSRTYDGEGGFRGLVPWLGASYEMSLSGNRTKTNIAIIALSPQLTSDVNFTLTIPALRGLIWNQPWTAVKISGVVENESREDFRRNLMDVVRGIEDAYWNVIALNDLVKVAEKSLETANALVEQVKTQHEVGVVSKVEIAQAEAGAADREFRLIVAQNNYAKSMDALIDLVLGPKLTPDSQLEIVPTDRPDQYVTYKIDAEEATRIAFQNRPELAIAEQEIERQEIGLKFAKNQRLPQLDGVLSYGNSGLAGSGNPACVQFTGNPNCANVNLGNFGDTFDGFIGDAAHQFVARALLTVPIPNTSGRHGVSRAQLELRRSETEKRRVVQNIILEVRDAARDIQASQEGIESAKRGVVAAGEQLRAERIRLEYGESTPFDVLQKEEDFVRAEAQEIAAYQSYRTSVTKLDRAQGTILRNRNVSIEDAARLR
jgi:outer membrane protein TolC